MLKVFCLITYSLKLVKFKIEKNIQDIYFANRENIRLLSLENFNKLLNNLKRFLMFKKSDYLTLSRGFAM